MSLRSPEALQHVGECAPPAPPAIDAATQLCAVIGNPVGHSLSPAIHNAAFAAAGLNWVYLAFEVAEVRAFLMGMRAMSSFRGLSVTIPHKLAIMEGLDAIDPLAARIGAVNTVAREDGRLVGYNTDGVGTLRAFEEAGAALQGKNVLFLGAGGAVRAVAFAMAAEAAPAKITLLGRTRRKVEALAEDLARDAAMPIQTGALDTDLEAACAQADVIVQGTPVGMHPHDVNESPVPAKTLRPGQVVFDMVYRPLKTRLIQDAEAAGCKTILGLEMLLHQAQLQFERWTGRPAPAHCMREALLRALSH